MSERHSTFSSSSIWKLMTNDKKGTGFGAPGLKYIKQVRQEIALGRAINKEVSSKPLSWGKYIEERSFNKLSMDYVLISNKRLFHPEIPHFSGMPDLVKPDTVGDHKCPFSLEVFCDKIEVLESGDWELYKKEFPEDAWQLVSNAILLEVNGLGPITRGEAIIYVPLKSELQEIREGTALVNDPTLQKQLVWLQYADDNELPYLIDGGKYKNLNIFNFEIPEQDKEFLINRVKSAVAMLG